MTRRAWAWIAGGVVAVVVVLIGVWIAVNLHRSERTRVFPPNAEARANPLLACSRVLSELGLPTTSAAFLGQLPPVDHLLVLRTTGRLVSPVTSSNLLEWVRSGGHLIVVCPMDDGTRTALRDDIKDGTLALPLAEELGVECVTTNGKSDECAVEFDDEDSTVRFEGPLAFDDTEKRADVATYPLESARLLSISEDRGRATFVASDAWIVRKGLGEHDHAEALWRLAQLDGPRAGALLVYGERAPGLLTLIARYGWMVLVSAGVAIALYFARVGARFGPPLVALDDVRRDFSEHVYATGEFLVRHGATAALLEAPRKELRRKLHVTRPDLADLPREQLTRALSEISRLDARRVERALETKDVAEAELELVVRDLHMLRNAL